MQCYGISEQCNRQVYNVLSEQCNRQDLDRYRISKHCRQGLQCYVISKQCYRQRLHILK